MDADNLNIGSHACAVSGLQPCELQRCVWRIEVVWVYLQDMIKNPVGWKKVVIIRKTNQDGSLRKLVSVSPMDSMKFPWKYNICILLVAYDTLRDPQLTHSLAYSLCGLRHALLTDASINLTFWV